MLSDTGFDATIPAADTTNAGLMLPAQVTKLEGIAANAAALGGSNSTDVAAAGTTGVATTAARSDHAHAHGTQAGGTLHAEASTTVAGFMSSADKTKLNGVATGATVNSADSVLLNRANHTGTQLAATISNLSTALADATALGSNPLTGTVNLGPASATSTTSVTIGSGSGGIAMRPTNGNATVAIDGAGTGDLSLGGGSGTGNVLIGTGSAAAVNVGTGATSHAITIGAGTGATPITLSSGTGGLTASAKGAGAIRIAGTGSDLAATGAVELGTVGARAVMVGSNDGAASLELNAGTGGVILTAQGAGQTQIGNQSGLTGDIIIGTQSTANVAIGAVGTTSTSTSVRAGSGGPVTVSAYGNGILTLGGGGSAETGTINIGSGAQAVINVGSSATARSIVIGNTTGATSVAVRGGTGGVSITATGAGAVNLGTGTSSGAVTVGNANAALALVGSAITKSGRSLTGLKVGFWRYSASVGGLDFTAASLVQVVNNTSATWAAGAGAGGGFTLTAGRTYLLGATAHIIFSASTGDVQMSWRNATANGTAPFNNLVSGDASGANSAAFIKPVSGAGNESSSTMCWAAFTPTVNTVVKLYATTANSFTSYFLTNSIIIVEQD